MGTNQLGSTSTSIFHSTPSEVEREMGVTFSSFFQRISGLFSGQQEVRILMLGLDAAGKTTILYRLQIGEVVSTLPTIGFNVETLTYKNLKLQVWDLGGQSSIRPYWKCYYGVFLARRRSEATVKGMQSPSVLTKLLRSTDSVPTLSVAHALA